jgi:hypothetical protein
MIIFGFYVAFMLYLKSQGASSHEMQTWAGILIITYFVARILANWFFDADAHNLSIENRRRNFGRGHFAMWSENGKIHIETNGDERDHSQRCVDSLNESYYEERWARWNNWIYAAAILMVALLMHYTL